MPDQSQPEPVPHTIEEAAPEDVKDALPLLAAQFREHQIALDQPALRDALAGLVADSQRGLLLLLRVGGHAAGLATLSFIWTLEHGGRVAWLEELYVVPPLRGRGLGQALLDAALQAARDAGCRAIDLEVDATHARVESLYSRNGFTNLARNRFARALPPKSAATPK